MSGLLARQKRAVADSDSSESSESEGEPQYIKFGFGGGVPAIYVTARRFRKRLRKKAVVAEGNVINVARKYGPERDLDKPLADEIAIVADGIEEARQGGNPVILHCREGRARSLICLGIYLMKHKGWTRENVMKAINAAFKQETAHAEGPGLRVDGALLTYEGILTASTTGAAQDAESTTRQLRKRGKTTE